MKTQFAVVLLLLVSGCTTPLHRQTSPPVQPAGATATPRPAPAARPHETGVQPVNYHAPAASGCNRCNAVPCPPQAPHGYAIQPDCGWNTYGTDPQEFLCDGGDHHANAVVLRDDSIGGLDPEDTVVHYTTEAGKIELTASNRVCVYAPRFKSVRRITGAVAGGRAISASQVDRPQGAGAFDHDLPGLVVTDIAELGHADVTRRVDAMRERNRGVPVESVLQPEQADDVLAALAGIVALNLNEIQEQQRLLLEAHALAAVAWTLDEALEVAIEDLKPPTLVRDEQVAGLTVYDFPDAGRLRICKLADRRHAQPGEEVYFSIEVVNVGDRPVSQVTVADNLVTRLEYVPDSQTCSAGAVFETAENQGQSLRLQWTLTDTLKVGETATIRFRCRVR